MKQYDTYKDSGIAWIGEIPSEWEVGLIGKYFDEINNPNTNQEETNTLQFKMGEIISKKDGDSKYNPETIEAYNVVEPGTIMINGLNLSFDLVSQRVAQVHERGAITSTYLALSPVNGMESDYAKYLLKAYDNNKALHAMGRGLRATLSYGKFRTEPVLVPNSIEQQSIATFLDTNCGEIDALISLQEEMISELQAYKQSVITEAVTKGLNPHAKMKDSGVEWIGEIPKEWQMMRIKNISSNYKAGPFGSALITGNLLPVGNILVYTPEHVADPSKINQNFNNLFLQEERRVEMSNFFVRIGDIVFPIVGSLGRAIVISEDMPEGIINQRLSKFNINRKHIDEGYFMWLFGKSEFYAKYIEMNCRGSFIVNLTKAIIGDMPLPVPPLSEQHSIATYLGEKTSQIDALISLKQEKIEELKDYKKSIIYEYVTGKKRV